MEKKNRLANIFKYLRYFFLQVMLFANFEFPLYFTMILLKVLIVLNIEFNYFEIYNEASDVPLFQFGVELYAC